MCVINPLVFHQPHVFYFFVARNILEKSFVAWSLARKAKVCFVMSFSFLLLSHLWLSEDYRRKVISEHDGEAAFDISWRCFP